MSERKKVRTLIIEDDPFSVAVLRSYADKLKKFNLEINHIVNLEESLLFLDHNKDLELIFLDYRVHSKITGLEILQHIRAKGFKIPVIIITGSGSEEVAVAMMKAGASDYIIKGTLDPAMLEQSVQDALEQYEKLKGMYTTKGKTAILKDMAIRYSMNGVCVINLQGIVTYVNPSFIKMWGYTSEEDILKHAIYDFLLSAEDFAKIIKAVTEKKSWLGEVAAKRKDGSVFIVQTLFSFVEEEQGSAQIMISFLDITQIKDMEKRREALYKGIMEVFALEAEEVGNVETAGHIRRIAAYVRVIAHRLKTIEPFTNYIDQKYIDDVAYASMLHDVGKWRTPNEILLKPSGLTNAEWEIMKKHPKLGAEMLSPLLKGKGSDQYLKLVESVVMYHHERWDGKGYPEGLKGEEIPLSARIVSLADAYDALTSYRSYREALTHEDAYKILERDKDKFDPRIWQIFSQHHEEFKEIRDQIT